MGLKEFIDKVDKKVQEFGDSISNAINSTGGQIGDSLNKGMQQMGKGVDMAIKADHPEVPQYTGDGNTSFQDVVNNGVQSSFDPNGVAKAPIAQENGEVAGAENLTPAQSYWGEQGIGTPGVSIEKPDAKVNSEGMSFPSAGVDLSKDDELAEAPMNAGKMPYCGTEENVVAPDQLTEGSATQHTEWFPDETCTVKAPTKSTCADNTCPQTSETPTQPEKPVAHLDKGEPKKKGVALSKE